MAFADPPYHVDYEGKTAKKLKFGNDTLGGGFYDFLREACVNVLASTKGAIYVCMSSSGSVANFGSRRLIRWIDANHAGQSIQRTSLLWRGDPFGRAMVSTISAGV